MFLFAIALNSLIHSVASLNELQGYIVL